MSHLNKVYLQKEPNESRPAIEAESTLPIQFSKVARLYPDHLALSSTTGTFTYEALDAASNALASHLSELGGNPGDRVALLMDHDNLLIVGLLAILKAGNVVVTLSPHDPPSRLNDYLQSTGVRLLLTDSTYHDLSQRLTVSQRLMVDPIFLKKESSGPVTVEDPGAIACLIQTSGSAGQPKAVIHTHRNIVHNAYRLGAGMELTPDDHVVLLASPGGGQGLATVISTLLHGATLFPYPILDRGVNGLAEWMEVSGISIFVSSASLFRRFMQIVEPGQRFSGVRLVRLASEPASDSDFRRFQEHFPEDTVLFSTLSSSETGNISQARIKARDHVPAGRLTVGSPAEGVEIRILTEDGNETSTGETGDIIVKSRYLAAGYWNDETLSSEHFSAPDPADGSRIYRSGDRGFWAEDGSLMFVGREDNRVKIKGYRIDLQEIEDVIQSHDNVQQAIVDVRKNSLGEERIAAYVVRKPGTTLSTSILRTLMRKHLPEYMVPGFIVFLDQLPLNANGKIDRSRLRTTELKNPRRQRPSEPKTETERLLIEIWKSVFESEQIDPEDHFFDLGGDSLSAVVLGAKIYETWGFDTHLSTLNDYPRLVDFARMLDHRIAGPPGEKSQRIVRVPREGTYPLSFSQERCWRYSQTPEDSAGYTVSCSYSLTGPLDEKLFKKCLDELVERHEILRMRFFLEDGVPMQTILPPCPADYTFLDLSRQEDSRTKAEAYFKAESIRIFDVSGFPLLKFYLLKLAEHEYWLIRCGHHIISDGWSFALLFQELGCLYEAHQRGADSPLSDHDRVQYVDYAVWQRRQFHPESPDYRAAVIWWRKQFHQCPQKFELPFRRQVGVTEIAPEAGVIRWGLNENTPERLDELARRENTTFFVTRLAAFAALLFRVTGQNDLVLGTYVSNRDRLEVQNMFGFVSNVATLRFRCQKGITFRSWLSEVSNLVMEVQRHNAIPYEELCRELRENEIPVPEIQAIFSISSHHFSCRFGEVQMNWLDRRMEHMPWGFSMTLDTADEKKNCRMLFDARIYDPVGVQRFTTTFSAFLREASLDPDATLDRLYDLCGAAILYPQSLPPAISTGSAPPSVHPLSSKTPSLRFIRTSRQLIKHLKRKTVGFFLKIR